MTVSAEKFTRQQLLSVQAWSPSLFSLRCTRDPGFRFVAGQFARLGVRKADGSTVWRAYSMASAAHDEFLEFFSIVVPGGEFTSELSRLAVGDELLVERQAFGFLTLDRFVDGSDLWLLASGTGLAPFLSILQGQEVWQRFARIVLVYSARSRQELAYQALIQGLQQREVGGYTVDAALGQCALRAAQRIGKTRAARVHDELGQQRVVVRRRRGARCAVRVHAHSGACGQVKAAERAAAWGGVALRVQRFGVDAPLNRKAQHGGRCGRVETDVPQPAARRQRDLRLHQVHASDLFGDRVLHLQARVALDEHKR